jgi:type I restriction enzyme S subunit
MSDWREVLLEDVAEEITVGYVGPMASEYVAEGVPFLRSQNVEPLRINLQDMKFITMEFHDRLAKSALSPGDVVIVRTGKPGACAVIPDSLPVSNCSDVVIVRCGEKLNAKFLAYYINTVAAHHVSAHLVGAVQQHFNVSSARKMRMRLPQINEQRAIASLLGALDDKIELNRRMNETLESLAQSLFQEWFVAPTRNGLPEGWRDAALPEVIKVNPTRSLRKGEVAPYLDMANMPMRSARAMEVFDREFGSGMRFMDGDTLVARITPCLENGKTCFVDFLGDGKVGWGSTEYIVLCPKPPLPQEFAYFLARTEGFRAFAISNMTGTSGRQRVPADCLIHFTVAVPPTALAEKFGEFARSTLAKMKTNDEESRTLAALRDALLPRLLSGAIRARI